MNKSQRLLSLIEAVLKMKKIDYKSNPHGPIQHDPIDKGWAYNSFKKSHHRNLEIDHTLPAHDVLSKEAHEQFGEDDKHGTKKDAVKEYTGTAYTSINNHLRHGHSISDENKLRVGHLKTLTKNKTKHSFTAYRTTSDRVTDTTPGTMFQDHGFTSTTLRPSFGVDNFDGGGSRAQNFIVHVKKGTKGHYVSAHSFSNGEGHEKEFLLHPGTKFKVGKTVKHANGNTYTHLHIHSQEADSHPDDFKVPEKLDIDKESPNADHKLILTHYKNHHKYDDDGLKSLHKSLTNYPEDVKGEADQLRKNHPHLYPENKTHDIESVFSSKEWGDAFGHGKQEKDTHGIADYHTLDRDHKSILDNAKHNHGYDNDSVKDLHHIVKKLKTPDAAGWISTYKKQNYAKLLANAKSKSDPYDNLE